MKIVFLTNEFVIEFPKKGGLGQYLNRVSRVLLTQGHQVEIISLRVFPQTPDVVDFNGVRVTHVPLKRDWLYTRLRWFDRKFLKSPWGFADYISTARSLAQALEQRHQEIGFDLVQSTNCGASGLFVPNRPGRLHLARISSLRELYFRTDLDHYGIGARMIAWLETRSLKQAHLIYSPSQFSAGFFQKRHHRPVLVLRPPFFIEHSPDNLLPPEIPPRYLVHYGSIGPVKGSDWLARALPLVWAERPDFKMVWLGQERIKGCMEKYKADWKEFQDNIIWFKEIAKPVLYQIVSRAVCVVQPSRVDNLPNTVMEALFLNVPVIGSMGSSIDEMIEDGKSGYLVPNGDIHALARVLMDAWDQSPTWLPDGFQQPPLCQEVEPGQAARNLVELARKNAFRTRKRTQSFRPGV